MNRMEEALRRAWHSKMPESLVPEDGALDQFPSIPDDDGEQATARKRDSGPADLARSAEGDTLNTPPLMVTADKARNGGSSGDRDFTGKLVINTNFEAGAVEQYRRLAATLHHAQRDQGTKVVMIASAMPREGKTLTAVNLALTLSESYRRRVLLIDADFRRPMLHQVFQVPNDSGLNDGLKADADRDLTVEISKRLSLLPAGRPDPDPMSGLTSGRMRRVIDDAAARFDWVVLDTPPLGLLTDAHLLAAMVNVAVLVIHAAHTPYALVKSAIDSLDRSRIIGVVLNRVDSPGGRYSEYYRSHYRRPADELATGSVS